MIGRVALTALAVVVCAWFVLGSRQAHDLDSATSIVGAATVPDAQQAARARALLSSASTLNPDREVDIQRGMLALELGHRAAAVSILERVTREEPMNLVAWVDLAQAGYGDPAISPRAVRQLARLDPGPAPSH
jgi:predicted Zn-dependent protease